MARYLPPTRVVTRERPWLSMVNQADPDFERRKHREVEYVSSLGKAFSIADPYQRNVYNRRSGVYAVGQPYGGPDAAIAAALAPTIGSPVPGLYKGVDDLAGWA